MKELIRTLIDGITPQPPRHPKRTVAPRYFDRPATGVLDADLIHSHIAQAKGGNMTPLLSLYREIEVADDVIASNLNSRKLAVLSDLPTVQPCRKGVLEDQRAADAFQRALDLSPSFLDGCKHWLSGVLWPVSVCQVNWLPGRLDYSSFNLTPIPLEQLDYSHDYTLRIAAVSPEGMAITGQSIYPDPAQFICHRGHLSTHSDTWGGPFRALVFWHLFGACNRDWLVRFLERFGAPFLVGRYDPDDEESRANLETAFAEAARTFGIVATTGTQIELHEAKSAVGTAAFESFHNIAERAKIRVILGQTLSSKNDASGMNSGNAALQGEVRGEYKQWDRIMLATTIRKGLAEPFMSINRLPGQTPKISWPGDPADLARLGSYLQTAAAAGLEVDDTGLEAINDLTGITLRRATPTPSPQSPFTHPNQVPQNLAAILQASAVPPGVVATGSLSRKATADYLRALGKDHAGLSRILANATTTAQLMDALEAHFASIHQPETAKVLTALSNSAAANARL
jgi:phage gp29-like protein